MARIASLFKASPEALERQLQRRKEKAIERYMNAIDARERLAGVKAAIARCPGVLARRVSRLAGAAKGWLASLSSTTRGHVEPGTVAQRDAARGNPARGKGGHDRAGRDRASCHARASKDLARDVEDPARAFATGIARLEAHDLPGAVACFTAASARDPGWVMPLYVLARVHHDAGRLDEAIEWCQRALAVDPGLTLARHLLEGITATAGRDNHPALVDPVGLDGVPAG